jgi:hypothetical protein
MIEKNVDIEHEWRYKSRRSEDATPHLCLKIDLRIAGKTQWV